MSLANSNTDEVLSLTEAAAAVPALKGRKKLHPSTLWRWCRRGIKTRSGGRVRLRHARYGGVLGVTRADLNAFFSEVAAADLEHFDDALPPAPPRWPATTVKTSAKAREKAIAKANAILDEAGI